MTIERSSFFVGCLLLWATVFCLLTEPEAYGGGESLPHKLSSASELAYPPFCIVRQDGTADGFSVALLKAVVQAVGHDIDFKVGPWYQIKQDLIDGRLDVLPLVSYSRERDMVFDFSIPYIRMHGTSFVRKGETAIRGEADLKEREVIVMRGDTAHEYALKKHLSDKLILTDTFEAALTQLSAGKHDAVLIQYLVGLQLIKKLNLTNLVSTDSFQETSLKPVAQPLSGFEQKFCFAVPEGKKELLAHLNEGLSIVIAGGLYDELYHKWFGPILPKPAISKVMLFKSLLTILLPLVGLMAGVGIWYLKREVAVKTKALREEIQDRKQIEAELKKSKEAADVANEAKSEFLANMSHEIRTPINAMLGFSQMLQDRHFGPLNSKQSKYVDHIIVSGHRLLLLVNDILDLAKVESGKLQICMRSFHLDQLMERVRQTLTGLAGKKHLAVEVQIEPNIPKYLIGDDGRLEQVLRNLISNAVKFTKQGRIELSVTQQGADELLFSVSDTGDGIPPDKQAGLFTKFYQADSSYAKMYAGSGLGLAISKELVELMGGQIGFTSKVGTGSVFYFTLTLEASPDQSLGALGPHQPLPAHYPASLSGLRCIKVLLAEDDDLSRISLSHFLNEAGHEITSVTNGYEVLKALETDHFDLVLMDIQMPGMDGIEVTQHIRNEKTGKFDSRIPIIALTAYAMEGDRDRCIAAGMNDYVTKPPNMNSLLLKMMQFSA